ncbi:MAG: radical SAM protein, partial [Planctomycetes bacterium]|nr:radical SAM protein [Planctomycetota bacterium]
MHDFAQKLQQPSLWPRVVDYVRWQRALREAEAAGVQAPDLPDLAPLSINLDLTTACNYACDHCIDWDILNSKVRHEDDELRASIERMAARGLRSVILIGGGEPTLYPGFVSFVEFCKQLALQVAVVSNGSRNDRILQAAPFFTKGDWVRLSLDAGSNDVWRRMHNPSSKTLTLDEICGWIHKIKAV